MTGHRLLLITDGPDGAPAAPALAAISPPPEGLEVTTARLADATARPAILDAADLVWLVATQAGEGGYFDLLGELHDRHLPALLTRADEPGPFGALQDGAVLCPPDSDPAAVAGLIAGLRSQASVARELRAELKLVRAHQGGLCDQIGRIDEELRLAAQLQREFLPKSLVSVGDVAFRVLFRPASYVSGDIYDVVRLDERHVGFFIADAVGHGVPAALLTMYIKRSLVTKKIDTRSAHGYRLTTPGEALAKVNHDMVEGQSGHVRFATAIYGVIDCQTRRVSLARAGHPFPIVLRRGGDTQTLEPDGGLLGVFAEETYEEVTVQLDPGDRLLLYSDGFEMAFPGEDGATRRAGKPGRVASTRYAREFEDFRVGTLDEAILRLEEKLDLQVGSLNQRDDLTILCLGIDAAAAEAARPAERAA